MPHTGHLFLKYIIPQRLPQGQGCGMLNVQAVLLKIIMTLSNPNPPPSSSRTSLTRSHILWIYLLVHDLAPPLREKTSLRFGFFAGAFAGKSWMYCRKPVIASHPTGWRGNPYSVGDAKGKDRGLIYLNPTHRPFNAAFPYGKAGCAIDSLIFHPLSYPQALDIHPTFHRLRRKANIP